MLEQIVECVPNFSEGRDTGIIEEISACIRSVAGVQLLSVEPGADVNRTVTTFIGPPDAVAEAAFQAIKRAAGAYTRTRLTPTVKRLFERWLSWQR